MRYLQLVIILAGLVSLSCDGVESVSSRKGGKVSRGHMLTGELQFRSATLLSELLETRYELRTLALDGAIVRLATMLCSSRQGRPFLANLKVERVESSFPVDAVVDTDLVSCGVSLKQDGTWRYYDEVTQTWLVAKGPLDY